MCYSRRTDHVLLTKDSKVVIYSVFCNRGEVIQHSPCCIVVAACAHSEISKNRTNSTICVNFTNKIQRVVEIGSPSRARRRQDLGNYPNGTDQRSQNVVPKTWIITRDAHNQKITKGKKITTPRSAVLRVQPIKDAWKKKQKTQHISPLHSSNFSTGDWVTGRGEGSFSCFVCRNCYCYCLVVTIIVRPFDHMSSGG